MVQEAPTLLEPTEPTEPNQNKAEPPVNACAGRDTSNTNNKCSSKASSLHVGSTIISGLTLLGVSLDLRTNAIIESCQQIATSLWNQALQIEHCNMFQTACQIAGLIGPPSHQQSMAAVGFNLGEKPL